VERPSFVRGENVADQTVLHHLKAKTVKPLGDGYGMAAFSLDGQTLIFCLFALVKNRRLATATGASSVSAKVRARSCLKLLLPAAA
jgi:hypothetical protein